MSWMLFALISATLLAAANLIDKVALVKWIKNPMNSVTVLGIVQLISSLIVFSIKGFAPLTSLQLLLFLACGVLNMLTIILYFKAVKLDDISSVVPIFSLTPILVLIFAAAVLQESLPFIKYVGVFLLVSGALLINFKPKTGLEFNKAFFLVLLSVFFLAFQSIIIKYTLASFDYWTVFAYTRLGTVFITVPVFIMNYADLKAAVKRHGVKVIGFTSLSETITAIGIILSILASSLGPITLVSAFFSVQNFIILGFTLALSRFFPKILKEDLSRQAIILKALALIVLSIGVYLVS